MVQIESIWIIIFFALFFMSVGGVLTQLVGWSLDTHEQKKKEQKEVDEMFAEPVVKRKSIHEKDWEAKK